LNIKVKKTTEYRLLKINSFWKNLFLPQNTTWSLSTTVKWLIGQLALIISCIWNLNNNLDKYKRVENLDDLKQKFIKNNIKSN